MEAIKQFYIDLDLETVSCMYDYEHSTFVYPESGQWDRARLKRLFLPPDVATAPDEAAYTRINLLDQAFTAGGVLEKHLRTSKQEDNKENLFTGIPECSDELPFRLLPVLVPGDSVRGRVVLELTEDLEAERLAVSFKGGTRVKIRIYYGKGSYDDVGSEKYVDEEQVLWEESSDGRAETDAREELDVPDHFTLLAGSTSRKSSSRILRHGRHEFGFEFCLAADVRGSVPPLINSCHDYAHLVYRLKATLDKGKLWKRGNIVVSRGVWVKKDFDIASVPDLLLPVTAEETLRRISFHGSGRLCCRAALDRKAFIRGETIHIRLEIENGCRHPINSTSARVVLDGRVWTGDSKQHTCQSVHIKSQKICGEGVPADTVETRSFSLPLVFDDIDSQLIPVGSLNCQLIDVNYEVAIKLKMKGIRRNLVIKIPVNIGTINSAA